MDRARLELTCILVVFKKYLWVESKGKSIFIYLICARMKKMFYNHSDATQPSFLWWIFSLHEVRWRLEVIHHSLGYVVMVEGQTTIIKDDRAEWWANVYIMNVYARITFLINFISYGLLFHSTHECAALMELCCSINCYASLKSTIVKLK